ncbi:hypothetical protein [Gemelliphila palaticanis]|uniref:Uncharacterized protein n=1 Tax=Gemelliphila palaticanis TaxID=81950 RepID=A0ABX2T084_9BACL|nr:hypothetical protein [Gemella palaticanis]MBF0716117.1 hypothetical protein [Gemella palaticanis]NYS48047.1 hypothetical protein [Gemella palaticanis]
MKDYLFYFMFIILNIDKLEKLFYIILKVYKYFNSKKRNKKRRSAKRLK